MDLSSGKIESWIWLNRNCFGTFVVPDLFDSRFIVVESFCVGLILLFDDDDNVDNFDIRLSAHWYVSVFAIELGIEWARTRYVSQPKSFNDIAPSGVWAIKLRP